MYFIFYFISFADEQGNCQTCGRLLDYDLNYGSLEALLSLESSVDTMGDGDGVDGVLTKEEGDSKEQEDLDRSSPEATSTVRGSSRQRGSLRAMRSKGLDNDFEADTSRRESIRSAKNAKESEGDPLSDSLPPSASHPLLPVPQQLQQDQQFQQQVQQLPRSSTSAGGPPSTPTVDSTFSENPGSLSNTLRRGLGEGESVEHRCRRTGSAAEERGSRRPSASSRPGTQGGTRRGSLSLGIDGAALLSRLPTAVAEMERGGVPIIIEPPPALAQLPEVAREEDGAFVQRLGATLAQALRPTIPKLGIADPSRSPTSSARGSTYVEGTLDIMDHIDYLCMCNALLLSIYYFFI